MKGKKGPFGFSSSLGKFASKRATDWVDVSTFLIEGQEPVNEEEPERPNFALAKIALVLIALVLGLRLTNLQIVFGSENRFLAEGNRVRRQITLAPRGAIVDRKGESLVMNEPGYSVDVIPADLPRKKDERQAMLQKVADVTKVPLETLTKQLDQSGLSSFDPVSLVSNLPREDALVAKLRLSNLSAIHVNYSPTRRYDTIPGLSHLLGYTARMTDKDIDKHPDYPRFSLIGRTGLESSYDETLRGEVGTSEIEVNAQGQFQRLMRETPPKVGKTHHLTLDKGLQQEMAAALQEAMGKSELKQAVGVALDPRTGGILASVSFPTYDNNLFAKGISNQDYQNLINNPDKPLVNRAVDGLYAPGSTIKPFVAAAGLQEKTITPDTKLDTSAGVIKIGQWEFPDWKRHGTTDVKQAIAESNNIFFYSLGGGYGTIPGLGVERLKKYLTMFGFGQSTPLDFAPSQSGVIPDPEWKKKVLKDSWYIGDTYHMSIGQGDVLASPLQLARAVSAIANGGKLVMPHLVDSIESPDASDTQKLEFAPSQLPFSPETIETVRQGMRRTVESETGSARSLSALPFTSGGKTGTAQFGPEEKTNAWYIGFAPYDTPEIAVAIVVKGGQGHELAVPAAGRVMAYYMSHR